MLADITHKVAPQTGGAHVCCKAVKLQGIAMRIAIYSLLLIAAGCAGQPSQPPAAAAPTKYISNAPVVDPAAAAAVHGDKDWAKLVSEAKRRGYTLVNQDGETLFCHTGTRTGSHVVADTTCVTEAQMDSMRRQTQQVLQTNQMQAPPPQGK
jgi:hypothetical protein